MIDFIYVWAYFSVSENGENVLSDEEVKGGGNVP